MFRRDGVCGNLIELTAITSLVGATLDDNISSFVECFAGDLIGILDGDGGGHGNEYCNDSALGDPDTRV